MLQVAEPKLKVNLAPIQSPPVKSMLPDLGADEIIGAAKALGVSGGGSGTAALLALLYDTTVDVDAVLRCLKSEPALAALVLKVSNSAYYRQSRSVGTLDRALQVLGLSAIRGIAAAGCMDRVPVPSVDGALDAGGFRRHSLAVAVAAQELSRRAAAGVDAEAFMAGLLHDIGIVLLARLRPQQVALVAELPVTDPRSRLQAEASLIGANHAQCAAMLANVWGLPVWLGAALLGHHVPDTHARVTGTDALPALLALADHAAAEAGFGLPPLCDTQPDPACAASVGLDDQTCREVASGIAESLQRLSASA